MRTAGLEEPEGLGQTPILGGGGEIKLEEIVCGKERAGAGVGGGTLGPKERGKTDVPQHVHKILCQPASGRQIMGKYAAKS